MDVEPDKLNHEDPAEYSEELHVINALSVNYNNEDIKLPLIRSISNTDTSSDIKRNLLISEKAKNKPLSSVLNSGTWQIYFHDICLNESSLFQSIGNTHSIGIALELLPEGIKNIFTATLDTSTKDLSYFDCNSRVQFPIACSLSQMKVPCLKISIYVDYTTKSRLKQKRSLGYAIVDINGIIRQTTPSSHLIPISSSKIISTIEQTNIIGSALISSHYFPNIDSKAQITDLKSMVISPLSHFNESKQNNFELHIGLGDINIPIELVNQAILSNEGIALICRVNGNLPESLSYSCLVVKDNNLVWNQPDLILSLKSYNSVLPQIQFLLIKSQNISQRGEITSDHELMTSVSLAEATITTTISDCLSGAPINWTIPFRAVFGGSSSYSPDRVCILYASGHITSLTHKASNNPKPSLNYSPVSNTEVNEADLLVTIRDGSFDNPFSKSHLQPFFECSLIPPSIDLTSSILRSRTGFAVAHKTWSTSTRLKIPMLYPVNMIDEAHGKQWGLIIVCKDSIEYGNPDIGWARLTIPWKALLNRIQGEETIEEWINVFKFPIATSSNNHQVDSQIGRIKVCLSFPVSSFSDDYSLGIGSVVVQVDGLLDGHESNEVTLPISYGTVSSYRYQEDFVASVIGPDTAIDEYRFSEKSLTRVKSSEETPSHLSILPVPGGASEIKVEAYPTTNSSAHLYGFMSTMSCVSSSVEGNPYFDLPVLLCNQNTDSKPRKNRIPRLRIRTCYVPYVVGSLIIRCKSIHMSTMSGANVSFQRCFLRIVLSPTVHVVMDVSSCFSQINPEKCSVEIPCDTLRLLTSQYSSPRPLTAEISLFVSSVPNDRILVGTSNINTSPLYHLASMNAAGSTSSSSVGVSPLLVSRLNISNGASDISASVTLETSFVMDSISENTMALLSKARDTSTDDIDTCCQAHLELGLKQAFKIADVDNSGSVSSSELLSVFKTRELKQNLGKKKSQPSIGLEDCMSLLCVLANKDKNSLKSNSSSNDLIGTVEDIFRRLDFNGDGVISWWEWKSVLKSAIAVSTRNHSSQETLRSIDPMDSLVLSLYAAVDALEASGRIPSSQTLSISQTQLSSFTSIPNLNTSSSRSIMQYVPISAVSTRSSSIVGISMSSVNSATPARAKAVNRFQKLVQSTREPSFSWDQSIGALKAQLASSGTNSPEIERIIQSLEYEKKNLELARIEHEHERSFTDSASINYPGYPLRQGYGSNASSVLREDIASNPRAVASSLALRIDEQNQKLSDFQANKAMKKSSLMKAMLLLRKAVHRFLRKKRKLALENLKNRLLGAVIRRKYLAMLGKRKMSAVLVQRLVRGFVTRRRMQKKHKACRLIQNWIRRLKRKHEVKRMLLDSAASKLSSEYKAASLLKRCAHKWWAHKKEVRKTQACITLQKFARISQAKKKRVELEIERENLRKQLLIEAGQKRERAAVTLQRWMRHRHHARTIAKIQKQVDAVIKIQRSIRRRQAHRRVQERLLMEENARKIREEDTNKLFPFKDLVVVRRPDNVVLSQGCHVRIPKTQDDADDEDHYGTVIDTDENKKTIKVAFHNIGDDIIEELPFKAPQLQWLSSPPSQSLDGPEEASLNNNKNCSLADEGVGSGNENYTWCAKPSIQDSVGYRIFIADEIDPINGVVKSFDVKRRLIYVQIDGDEDDNSGLEALPYRSEAIKWLAPK